MVKGIDIFRKFFKEYSENYVLIGGAACDEQMSEAGLDFRATKDLDIILIVEALNAEFVKQFWEFVKQGGYELRQKSKGERKYYRFLKPEKSDYPSQLEIFSRKPDLLDLYEDTHLTPIPVDEDLSSLSAILMKHDYYTLTIKNSKVVDGLHLALIEALICLKAKAFLDLKEGQENGEGISEKEIRKHKNDVIRLAVMLTKETRLNLPVSISLDMRKFLEVLNLDPPDYRVIGKSIGITDLNGESLIDQIKYSFLL